MARPAGHPVHGTRVLSIAQINERNNEDPHSNDTEVQKPSTLPWQCQHCTSIARFNASRPVPQYDGSKSSCLSYELHRPHIHEGSVDCATLRTFVGMDDTGMEELTPVTAQTLVHRCCDAERSWQC